jgi:hypothetical protein
MSTLEEQLEYFIANQEELVRKHRGKVLVLRNREVVGEFDSALEAYMFAEERFEAGTYAIQPCEPGPDAYTMHLAFPLSAAGA